jgi:hypothetical protein
LQVEDHLAFFAVATSLLPVLGVFHLIVTGPIKCWGCKLVFFPMKTSIASRLEISVERTAALLPVSCAKPQMIYPPHVTVQSRRQLPWHTMHTYVGIEKHY